MKHASSSALDRLEPLLERVREVGDLKETSRGVFYRRRRAALHFHEDASGLYADARGADEAEFTRLSVDDAAGRTALLALLTRDQPPVASSAAARLS